MSFRLSRVVVTGDSPPSRLLTSRPAFLLLFPQSVVRVGLLEKVRQDVLAVSLDHLIEEFHCKYGGMLACFWFALALF